MGAVSGLFLLLPQVRESKIVLDSGFRVPIVSGIPDSLNSIPYFKPQDSGFHMQKFPGFWIPQAKISRIPESVFPYMGRLIHFVNNVN